MHINELQHSILGVLSKENECTARQIGAILSVDESTVSRNLKPLLQQKIVMVKSYLPPTQFGGRKTRLLSL
ncbi:MarR family transcriptional regulator, partial [Pseudothermotoga sp.]|uniref:MarR family transcriptional regulator n=1 Tax=Pseudothermotoga sp. TaxID=2033661 RepID=UPI0034DE1E9E